MRGSWEKGLGKQQYSRRKPLQQQVREECMGTACLVAPESIILVL